MSWPVAGVARHWRNDVSIGVAAGRTHSGGLSVALPSASAKRSRVPLQVVDDCSSVRRGFLLVKL